MNTKKLILLLTIIFFSNSIIAQDSTIKSSFFLPNQIYLPSRFHFIINNSSVSINNLESYLKTNSEALKFYKQSKNSQSVGSVFWTVAFLSFLGSVATVNNDNHLSGKFAIASLATFITGGIFSDKSSNKLNKAICVYNTTH